MRKEKVNSLWKSLLIFLTFAIILVGCGLPGLPGTSKDVIRIDGLDTTEGQILSEMLKELIEHETDYEVDLISNLGTSVLAYQALARGDSDISAARYTGTDLVSILDLPPIKDPDEALQVAQEEFMERDNFKFFDSYGFDNTYAFMTTEALAEEYDLETVSDIEPYADILRAGIDSQWLAREGDGYKAFTEEYGFEIDNLSSMQIGLVYDALNVGSMDLVLGYSSDGRVDSLGLVTLEDDLLFFPPYDCAPMASMEILEEYPELEGLINRLVGQIDTPQMRQLNYKADHELIEPAIVAKEFLQENNYFRGDTNE